MSLVEVVCDVSCVIVIFGPAPDFEVFRQHFGMEGPMQLFTARHIAIPPTWDCRAWRCMSIRAADRREALVLRTLKDRRLG